MVEIKTNHFSSTARCATTFNGACSAVTNFKKLIRPLDVPPPLSFSPSHVSGKISSTPDPYLNILASLVHRSIIPPSVHQVVAYAQYKAGVRLGTLVCILRFFQNTIDGIHIIMALWFTGDAVCL